jgi:hypothetical protein
MISSIKRRLSVVLITLTCCAGVQIGFAQTYTISGHIADESSGEQLMGATVWCADQSVGAGTNTYGFYSLTLAGGVYDLLVSYTGYAPRKFEVKLDQDIKVDFALSPGVAISEAVVTGEAFNRIEDQVQMSKMEIPIDQIKRLPAIGGEVDLMKSLQLLPGVQSGGEGTSGLYVRGGSPDQNLMLLDGVPLYSVSHLFGFFSVFNADAVRNMTITKGGYPARYGGRLSSIVDISMKDGNMKAFHGTSTVSILSSKLTLEGPLVKDKASFMISGRRTYLDILLNPIINSINSGDNTVETDPRYYFYDFNGKINWKVGGRDRLYFSMFNGKDDFGLASTENFGSSSSTIDFGLAWTNSVAAARWNHEWGPRMFSNLMLTRSVYNFRTGIEFSESALNADSAGSNFQFASIYQSGIEDYTARMDFDFVPNPEHFIRFGASTTRHQFNPGATTLQLDFGSDFPPLDTVLGSAGVSSFESYFYAEDEIQPLERLKLNVGLHGSILDVQNKIYTSLQPRLALNYQLPQGMALKASFATMTQFVNLLTNEGLALPTDLWVPSTAAIEPQRSWQAAAGLAQSWKSLELSLEGYYKKMDGLLSYREGAGFTSGINENWEDQVTQGEGNSYGAEFLIQKKSGRTTGWVGYTLSWSNRRFDEINSGQWFPFTYDRRHDASIVILHRLSDQWDLSATWVYGTGRALTLSESAFKTFLPTNFGSEAIDYQAFNIEVPSSKNGYRTSPYHRADISITKTKKRASTDRSWIFSCYNVYNNLNPFFSLVDTDVDGTRVIREYGIFPIIPSVAWRIDF